MTNKTADELKAKIEAHIQAIEEKAEKIETSKTPVPLDELNRDLAIGLDLFQQYIDLLKDVEEEIESGGVE